MSQENMEIVRAQYASFGQVAEGGEVHSWVLGYFDPNCTSTCRSRRSTRFAVTRRADRMDRALARGVEQLYGTRSRRSSTGARSSSPGQAQRSWSNQRRRDPPAVLSRLRDARGQGHSTARVPGSRLGPPSRRAARSKPRLISTRIPARRSIRSLAVHMRAPCRGVDGDRARPRDRSGRRSRGSRGQRRRGRRRASGSGSVIRQSVTWLRPRSRRGEDRVQRPGPRTRPARVIGARSS